MVREWRLEGFQGCSEVDEDELRMSDRELYEADESYRNIRKLRLELECKQLDARP